MSSSAKESKQQVLVVGRDGVVRQRIVDPNNVPESMQRISMTQDAVVRLVQEKKERELAMANLYAEQRKRREEEAARENAVKLLELQRLELTKADRERDAAAQKLAAATAEIQRIAEEKRLKQLEIAAASAKKQETKRIYAEERRKAAEISKEAEALRITRLQGTREFVFEIRRLTYFAVRHQRRIARPS